MGDYHEIALVTGHVCRITSLLPTHTSIEGGLMPRDTIGCYPLPTKG